MDVERGAAHKRWIRIGVGAAVVALIVGGSVWLGRSFENEQALVAVLRGLGEVPPVAYVGIYSGLALVGMPMSVMIGSAGLILGVIGIPVVLVGATVGASLAFLVSRLLLREMMARWIQERPRLRSLERALSADAFRLTLFIRSSPAMPFGLFNYAAGALPVSFASYVLATFLGLAPRAILGVLLGAGLRSLLESGGLRALGPWEITALALGVLATVVVTVLLGKIARRALKEEVHPTDP